MRKHDCGCVTDWHAKLDHPVYMEACGQHKFLIPDGWQKSETRKPVKSSA